MLILIDGYNVIAPAAPPGRPWTAADPRAIGAAASRWLKDERTRLLQRLAHRLDPLLAPKTHVIFDSARPGRHDQDRFRVKGIHVRFAVNHDEADDLIEELIAAHQAPKRLTVVSSDRRLQIAARRAGATAFDSQPWFDALLDGKLWLAVPWPPRGATQRRGGELAKPDHIDQAEIEQWMRDFGISDTEVQQLADSDSGGADHHTPGGRLGQGEPQQAGQDRGRGSAGDRPREPPAPPPKAGKGKRRPDKNLPPQDPLPTDFNPFPEGYGEDLL